VRRLATTTRPSKEPPIRTIRIQSVPGRDSRSIIVNARILDGKKIVETKVLIDSGAQGAFIDE